mgnify:CR=1 FL=1
MVEDIKKKLLEIEDEIFIAEKKVYKIPEEKKRLIEEIVQIAYFKVTKEYIEFLTNLSIEELKKLLEILRRRRDSWMLYIQKTKK